MPLVARLCRDQCGGSQLTQVGAFASNAMLNAPGQGVRTTHEPAPASRLGLPVVHKPEGCAAEGDNVARLDNNSWADPPAVRSCAVGGTQVDQDPRGAHPSQLRVAS